MTDYFALIMSADIMQQQTGIPFIITQHMQPAIII